MIKSFPSLEEIKKNKITYFTYKGTVVRIERVYNWYRFNMTISHFNNTYGANATMDEYELNLYRGDNVVEYIIENLYKRIEKEIIKDN